MHDRLLIRPAEPPFSNSCNPPRSVADDAATMRPCVCESTGNLMTTESLPRELACATATGATMTYLARIGNLMKDTIKTFFLTTQNNSSCCATPREKTPSCRPRLTPNEGVYHSSPQSPTQHMLKSTTPHKMSRDKPQVTADAHDKYAATHQASCIDSATTAPASSPADASHRPTIQIIVNNFFDVQSDALLHPRITPQSAARAALPYHPRVSSPTQLVCSNGQEMKRQHKRARPHDAPPSHSSFSSGHPLALSRNASTSVTAMPPKAPPANPFTFGSSAGASGSTTGSGGARAGIASLGLGGGTSTSFVKPGPPAVIPEDSGFAPGADSDEDKSEPKKKREESKTGAPALPAFAFGASTGAIKPAFGGSSTPAPPKTPPANPFTFGSSAGANPFGSSVGFASNTADRQS